MIADLNWDISEEEIGLSKKKYVCPFDGCLRSYSKRQNCYRHRINDHKQCPKTKSVNVSLTTTASLQHEKDIVVEKFSSLYEKFGKDAAAEYLKENKKISELVVPLRRMIENEVTDSLVDAKNSESIVEMKLAEFLNSIPSHATDEMEAFNAVIKLVRQANLESINHLKLFSGVISLLVDHMCKFSEGVNPKFKQSHELKKVLDEMLMTEADRLELSPTSPTCGKRKATALDEWDCNNYNSIISTESVCFASSARIVELFQNFD
jgi:hypothetical protein